MSNNNNKHRCNEWHLLKVRKKTQKSDILIWVSYRVYVKVHVSASRQIDRTQEGQATVTFQMDGKTS